MAPMARFGIGFIPRSYVSMCINKLFTWNINNTFSDFNKMFNYKIWYSPWSASMACKLSFRYSPETLMLSSFRSTPNQISSGNALLFQVEMRNLILTMARHREQGKTANRAQNNGNQMNSPKPHFMYQSTSSDEGE